MKKEYTERARRVIEHLEQRIDRVLNRVTAHIVPKTEFTPEDLRLFNRLLERWIQGYQVPLSETIPIDQFEQLILESPDPICVLDTNGTVQRTNPAFEALFASVSSVSSAASVSSVSSLSPVSSAASVSSVSSATPTASLSPAASVSSSSAIGTTFTSLVTVQYKRAVSEYLDSLADPVARDITHTDGVLVVRLVGNSTSRSIEVIGAPLEAGAIVVAIRDLTANHELQERLQEISDNYDALSETINEAIVRINQEMTIVFANSAVRTTFGYEPADLIGEPFSRLFPDSIYKRHEEEFKKYFIVDDRDRKMMGLRDTFELLGTQRNRGIAPMEISFGNSKEYRGRTLTCLIRDITQRKNAERRLRHLAYHDRLTGLGNRDLFDLEIRRLFDDTLPVQDQPAALLFLDLDGFKRVNDTLGHDAGDNLLIQTTRRLVKTLREQDRVYRFGGDEFVVLLPAVRDQKAAAYVAHSILGEISQPYTLEVAGSGPTAARIGVSIGVSMLPEHADTPTTATKTADLAMYAAKSAGKNRFVLFDASMDDSAGERWRLEQGIKSSIEDQHFTVYYQPMVGTDGTIVGAEALLRWIHPTEGLITPDKFIPIAEETNQIIPLGAWALEQAFRDASGWREHTDRRPFVSINLSPKQFEQESLAEVIGNAINRTQITPEEVVLELTESAVMSTPERSIKTLQTLKEHHPGIRVAIDDFGTGYSSLSYLTRLPVDIIKIDRSFVTDLFSQNNTKVVQAIVDLAHSLEMQVIVEGVETVSQQAHLQNHQYYALQGFLLSYPLPAAQFEKILRESQAEYLPVADASLS